MLAVIGLLAFFDVSSNVSFGFLFRRSCTTLSGLFYGPFLFLAMGNRYFDWLNGLVWES